MLTNKEIAFLDDLEIRLQHQSAIKTKHEKDKALISKREFRMFYDILEKIHKDRDRRRLHARKTIAEKRKTDPYYARPNAQKKNI